MNKDALLISRLTDGFDVRDTLLSSSLFFSLNQNTFWATFLEEDFLETSLPLLYYFLLSIFSTIL